VIIIKKTILTLNYTNMRLHKEINNTNITIVLQDNYMFWEWFRNYLIKWLEAWYNDWYFKSKTTKWIIWYWYRTWNSFNLTPISSDYSDLINI